MLDRLLKIIVDRRNLEIKVLAVLVYQAGVSYRKVRDIFGCIEPYFLMKLYVNGILD